eukprot:CAMPEP_0198525606 /NCGR_PEP_ID=MMETSP1462-20131121/23459_1 /TAXON_ID=1333877 /ORGANISM="Brandtodinium nutriculum, Strain RCC3387" /LENGTH=50 /DNA_ID=CAMNT_0044255359 /DNA_START=346 /DNA_END=495 /DNA_ORIENTATION=-
MPSFNYAVPFLPRSRPEAHTADAGHGRKTATVKATTLAACAIQSAAPLVV